MRPYLTEFNRNATDRRIVFADDEDDAAERFFTGDAISIDDRRSDDGPVDYFPLDTYVYGDQPQQCPECGARTEYEPIGQTKSDFHECLNAACGYKFIGVDE